jgi:hypothetical protein
MGPRSSPALATLAATSAGAGHGGKELLSSSTDFATDLLARLEEAVLAGSLLQAANPLARKTVRTTRALIAPIERPPLQRPQLLKRGVRFDLMRAPRESGWCDGELLLMPVAAPMGLAMFTAKRGAGPMVVDVVVGTLIG